VVTVKVTKDGPYRVDGDVPLRDAAGDDVTKAGPAFLCRCGQSRNKPFCDGSHKRVGFDGTEVASRDAIAVRRDTYEGEGIAIYDDRRPSGALAHAPAPGEEPAEPELDPSIAALRDGPYRLRGGVQVIAADGERYERRNRQTLCRCGQSRNKPFCDGSHWNAGFKDPA
jgi:CDGSH-type Zn-finger protein